MKSLGSDNHSGVHPEILKSITEINTDSAAAYGTDELSKKLNLKIKELFGSDYESFHCFNGTAANVLCLRALCQSHHSVLCSDVSHLNLDECGAPEFILGSKLIPIASKNGKILLEKAKEQIIRKGDQHFSQVKVLSITQPTELGTVYSLEELKEIKGFCKKHQLLLHIDGARFANAAYTLKTSLKNLVEGADALSFGGTKNGLLGSELVLLKKEQAKDFKFFRKQFLQLPSKTRFLAAQFLRYFEDDLYLKIAEHSCGLASYLAREITQKSPYKPLHPVESNACFFKFPKELSKKLKKEMFFYTWDEKTLEVRLMTSFDSKKEELDHFVEILKKESKCALT